MTTFCHPSRLLRGGLTVDALGSGAVALLQLAATDALGERLQLPHALLWQTGLFMVAYVAMLAVMARAARLPVPLVLLVVVGNLGWAAGCLWVAAGTWLAPTGLGVAWLVFQALAVTAFAALQAAGLRGSPRAQAAGLSA